MERTKVEENASLRASNVALATELLERFSRDMDGWYDYLHDDIVVEFPYGASLGSPTRLEGKEACSDMFRSVSDTLQVQFSNICVSPMEDPNRLLIEYTGHGEPGGVVYNQTYICVQEFRDGKMILFREYWNALVLRDTFGDVSNIVD